MFSETVPSYSSHITEWFRATVTGRIIHSGGRSAYIYRVIGSYMA
jgi:hypothetical protein